MKQFGRIMKGVGGLYTVLTDDGTVLQGKARGLFRKDGIKPLAGDLVTVSVEQDSVTIVEIHPRKNMLLRPPVANIDKLVIISAAVSPAPSLSVIDRLTALAAYRRIEPVVVFSKCDLQDVSEYVQIYRRAGFASFAFSSVTGEGVSQFLPLFSHAVCALTGNTGAGKTSLLNRLSPDLALDTGEISKKLGRGRHTTRCVELFPLFDGYIADTPGFSALDFESGDLIAKEELASCFPDFDAYTPACRFTGCSHSVEKGCAVLEAVRDGKIEPTRHASYVNMYNEVKDIPPWQLDRRKNQ